jgi:hypothetical protein
VVDAKTRRQGRVGDAGLPEAVGFALGAGLMATALAALEAALSNSERARRLVRDGGVRVELERAAVDLGRWLIPQARESAESYEAEIARALDNVLARAGLLRTAPLSTGGSPAAQAGVPLPSSSPSVSR